MAFWLRAIEIKHFLEEYEGDNLEEVREKASAVLLNDGDPAVRDLGDELRAAKTETEFDAVSYTAVPNVAAVLREARKDFLTYRTPGPGTGRWVNGGGNPAVAEGWER